jgi:hypothetical protein
MFDGVTSIGEAAFGHCYSLTNVTIPSSVTNIGISSFVYCTNLTSIYFRGNVPSIGMSAFDRDPNAIIYYLPGTTGWSTNAGGLPASLWRPQISEDGSFGVQSNQFGFNINWASGMVAVIEACTNLTDSDWTPIQTNTLSANSTYFSDPNWTNKATCFYRIVWQ